jgi:hypothetical protein
MKITKAIEGSQAGCTAHLLSTREQTGGIYHVCPVRRHQHGVMSYVPRTLDINSKRKIYPAAQLSYWNKANSLPGFKS